MRSCLGSSRTLPIARLRAGEALFLLVVPSRASRVYV